MATALQAPTRPKTRHLRAVTRPRVPLLVLLGQLLQFLGGILMGPVLSILIKGRDLLLQLVGFTLLAYGAWMVYRPAGFIIAGLLVLYLQYLLAAPPAPDEETS